MADGVAAAAPEAPANSQPELRLQQQPLQWRVIQVNHEVGTEDEGCDQKRPFKLLSNAEVKAIFTRNRGAPVHLDLLFRHLEISKNRLVQLPFASEFMLLIDEISRLLILVPRPRGLQELTAQETNIRNKRIQNVVGKLNQFTVRELAQERKHIWRYTITQLMLQTSRPQTLARLKQWVPIPLTPFEVRLFVVLVALLGNDITMGLLLFRAVRANSGHFHVECGAAGLAIHLVSDMAHLFRTTDVKSPDRRQLSLFRNSTFGEWIKWIDGLSGGRFLDDLNHLVLQMCRLRQYPDSNFVSPQQEAGSFFEEVDRLSVTLTSDLVCGLLRWAADQPRWITFRVTGTSHAMGAFFSGRPRIGGSSLAWNHLTMAQSPLVNYGARTVADWALLSMQALPPMLAKQCLLDSLDPRFMDEDSGDLTVAERIACWVVGQRPPRSLLEHGYFFSSHLIRLMVHPFTGKRDFQFVMLVPPKQVQQRQQQAENEEVAQPDEPALPAELPAEAVEEQQVPAIQVEVQSASTNLSDSGRGSGSGSDSPVQSAQEVLPEAPRLIKEEGEAENQQNEDLTGTAAEQQNGHPAAASAEAENEQPQQQEMEVEETGEQLENNSSTETLMEVKKNDDSEEEETVTENDSANNHIEVPAVKLEVKAENDEQVVRQKQEEREEEEPMDVQEERSAEEDGEQEDDQPEEISDSEEEEEEVDEDKRDTDWDESADEVDEDSLQFADLTNLKTRPPYREVVPLLGALPQVMISGRLEDRRLLRSFRNSYLSEQIEKLINGVALCRDLTARPAPCNYHQICWTCSRRAPNQGINSYDVLTCSRCPRVAHRQANSCRQGLFETIPSAPSCFLPSFRNNYNATKVKENSSTDEMTEENDEYDEYGNLVLCILCQTREAEYVEGLSNDRCDRLYWGRGGRDLMVYFFRCWTDQYVNSDDSGDIAKIEESPFWDLQELYRKWDHGSGLESGGRRTTRRKQQWIRQRADLKWIKAQAGISDGFKLFEEMHANLQIIIHNLQYLWLQKDAMQPLMSTADQQQLARLITGYDALLRHFREEQASAALCPSCYSNYVNDEMSKPGREGEGEEDDDDSTAPAKHHWSTVPCNRLHSLVWYRLSTRKYNESCDVQAIDKVQGPDGRGNIYRLGVIYMAPDLRSEEDGGRDFGRPLAYRVGARRFVIKPIEPDQERVADKHIADFDFSFTYNDMKRDNEKQAIMLRRFSYQSPETLSWLKFELEKLARLERELALAEGAPARRKKAKELKAVREKVAVGRAAQAYQRGVSKLIRDKLLYNWRGYHTFKEKAIVHQHHPPPPFALPPKVSSLSTAKGVTFTYHFASHMSLASSLRPREEWAEYRDNEALIDEAFEYGMFWPEFNQEDIVRLLNCCRRKQPLSMGFPSKKAFDEELYKLSKLLELVRSPFWLCKRCKVNVASTKRYPYCGLPCAKVAAIARAAKMAAAANNTEAVED